jgi:HSP20 family molecular chaperone IbpA
MDVFDHFFSNLDRGWFPVAGTCNSESAVEKEALRLPRTNIEEKENSYEFRLEMPGLSKKDIEVSLEDGKLTVKGGRTGEKSEKNGNGDKILRREIRSTRFERSFSLGNEIDQENIKARMEDGVLTVTLAKKAEKLGRKVDVS